MEHLHRIVITVIFLSFGVAKLLALEFEVEAFARWGYPEGFMYFTGVLEVAGALGLWIRKLSTLAGLGLTVLMLGAMFTHVRFAEWPMLAMATAIFLLVASYVWRHRGDLLPEGSSKDDGADDNNMP